MSEKPEFHWKTQLHYDLELCCYLNVAWASKYSLTTDVDGGVALPIANLFNNHYSEQYSQTLCPNMDSSKEEYLHKSLKRFVEVELLERSPDGKLILLAKSKRKFSTRCSLLGTALKLFKKSQSISRIEFEVTNFIRSTLSLNKNSINGFKDATIILENLYKNQRSITEEELIDKLKQGIYISSDNLKKKIIRAFIEISFSTNLLISSKDRKNIILIQGKGDLWYLLSTLFGLPTEIEGLAFLFRGTLPIYNPPGNNIFIRGGLGCGKTTLASNIAFEVADKGGISIYFALEQNVENLENLYSSFGWNQHNEIEIEKLSSFGNASLEKTLKEFSTRSLKSGKGLFILVETQLEDFTTFYNFVDSVVTNALKDDQHVKKLIVLDPISAIKVLKNPSESGLRQSMARLLNKIRVAHCCSILIGEETTSGNGHFFFEESISDTAIRLRYSNDDYKKRTLEVLKSRLIPCVRGENRFVLGKHRVIVYPSASSYIAARRGRSPQSIGNTMKSGINGLDDMMGSNGIEAGTITTFVGEPGCGKTEIALCWLAYGTLFNKQGGIYITFSRSSLNPKKLLFDRAQMVLKYLFKDLKNNDINQLEKNFHLFNIICLPTDGLTAGQIIKALTSEIATKKRQKRVSQIRIVIDSLSQLEFSSGSACNDRSFLGAIVEIVKSDKIACLFCYSQDTYIQTPTLAKQQMISISDNHLEFRKIDISGIQRTAIFSEKSRNNNHPREAKELIITNDEIKVEPNLSLFSDIRKGKINSVSTEVFLHYEGRIQYSYNQRIHEYFKDTVDHNVVLHNEVYPQASAAQISRGGRVERTARLIQVDDLEIDSLNKDNISPIPMELLNEHTDLLKCTLKRIKFSSGDSYKALPYYVNVPILIYKNDNESVINSITDWEIFAKKLGEIDDDPNIPAFEFAKGSPENYNCFFLEILYSVAKNDSKKTNLESFFLNSLSDEIGKKSIKLFWKLCHKAHCLSKQHHSVEEESNESNVNKDKYSALNILQINPSFTYCRTWFTSIWEIFEYNKNISYTIGNLPQNSAVFGSWYLAIPKNGPAIELQQKHCVILCSRDRAIERFEKWIGIPAYKTLYGNQSYYSENLPPNSIMNFARRHLLSVAEKGIIRTKIPGYKNFSSLLSFYLQRILEIPEDVNGETPVESINREFHEAIIAIKTTFKDNKYKNSLKAN